MGSNYGYVSWTWLGVVKGDILLDGEVKDIFLCASRRLRILADVLTGHNVLHNAEGERRHSQSLGQHPSNMLISYDFEMIQIIFVSQVVTSISLLLSVRHAGNRSPLMLRIHS